jgi:hypothetical protein
VFVEERCTSNMENLASMNVTILWAICRQSPFNRMRSRSLSKRCLGHPDDKRILQNATDRRQPIRRDCMRPFAVQSWWPDQIMARNFKPEYGIWRKTRKPDHAPIPCCREGGKIAHATIDSNAVSLVKGPGLNVYCIAQTHEENTVSPQQNCQQHLRFRWRWRIAAFNNVQDVEICYWRQRPGRIEASGIWWLRRLRDAAAAEAAWRSANSLPESRRDGVASPLPSVDRILLECLERQVEVIFS